MIESLPIVKFTIMGSKESFRNSLSFNNIQQVFLFLPVFHVHTSTYFMKEIDGYKEKRKNETLSCYL